MLLSIITINYNNKLGLEKTFTSLNSQTYKDFEYIVIDGGSSDGSLEVINSNISNISTWCSEKDNGVYDAMNKGIAFAKGKYLLMLNSGDYLSNHMTLANVFNFLGNKDYDIVYGDVTWDDNGLLYAGQFPNELSFNYFRQHSLGHQTAFIKKDLHNIVGNYDTNIKISSDWKFFLLAVCKYNIQYLHIDAAIAVCSRDGISCDPKSLPIIQLERQEILNEHFSAFLTDYTLMDEHVKTISYLKNNFLFKIYNKVFQNNNG